MSIPKQKEEGLCIRIPKKQELKRRMRKKMKQKGIQLRLDKNLTSLKRELFCVMFGHNALGRKLELLVKLELFSVF